VSYNGPVSIGAQLQHAEALWMAAAVSKNGSSEVRSLAARLRPSDGDGRHAAAGLAALDLNGKCGSYCSDPVPIAHPLCKPSVRDVYDVYNSNAGRINIPLDCWITMTVAGASRAELQTGVRPRRSSPQTGVVAAHVLRRPLIQASGASSTP